MTRTYQPPPTTLPSRKGLWIKEKEPVESHDAHAGRAVSVHVAVESCEPAVHRRCLQHIGAVDDLIDGADEGQRP
jgi:hypothetical protein